MSNYSPTVYRVHITHTDTIYNSPICRLVFRYVKGATALFPKNYEKYREMVEGIGFKSFTLRTDCTELVITREVIHASERDYPIQLKSHPITVDHSPKTVITHIDHIDSIKPSELHKNGGASVTIVTLKWLLNYCNRVYGRGYDIANITYRGKHMFIPAKNDSLNRHLVLPSNTLEACDALHEIIMRKQQTMV